LRNVFFAGLFCCPFSLARINIIAFRIGLYEVNRYRNGCIFFVIGNFQHSNHIGFEFLLIAGNFFTSTLKLRFIGLNVFAGRATVVAISH
jgi:hypothetical protein